MLLNRIPRGFRLFVCVAAAVSLLVPWSLLADELGVIWAFFAALGIHVICTVLALKASALVPRWLNTPSYTLHQWLMPYDGPCPAFERREQYPDWALAIEREFPAIKQEFERALAQFAGGAEPATALYQPDVDAWLPQSGDGWISDRNTALVTREHAWQHLEVARHCPRTFALLEAIPGFRGECSFSRLTAGSRIKLHCGESDIYYRCHLGVSVPGPLPQAGFQVAGEQRSWEEGRLLIFCDGYPHTAWNDFDRDRVVLLFSVMRPQFERFERGFFRAYPLLLYLKTGIMGDREPIFMRPVFAWLTAMNVIYVNCFGRLHA